MRRRKTGVQELQELQREEKAYLLALLFCNS
jgi:hypothetical protein